MPALLSSQGSAGARPCQGRSSLDRGCAPAEYGSYREARTGKISQIEVSTLLGESRTAVISSPDLGVFAVAAAGVLCAFPVWWTRYLDSVSAARLAQIPLSLPFLELSSYYVNAVQLHVHAADVLVRRGMDREGSRYPPN